MKQLVSVSFFFVTLAVSLCFSTKVQVRIDHRLLRIANSLARTSCAPYVADVPWAGRLQGQYVQLAAYHDANLALVPHAPNRVIFIGDSITLRWAKLYPSEFFPGKAYINRGIDDQNTAQMVWRFHQDVIALHPSVVVILAGTNDVAYQKTIDPQTQRNIRTMVEMAQHHGVRVVLCSIPPLSFHDPGGQAYIERLVLPLNEWLRSYAAEQHLAFVDYYHVLVDKQGEMPPSLATDGVEPNLAGYALMRPLAQQAIDATLQP